MSIFIQNKKFLINNSIALFFYALFARLVFLFLNNSSAETLIEDELFYWKYSLNYLHNGSLDSSVLNERMPGIFLYIKFLLKMSSENFKIFLILQSMVDSFTCILIYKLASLIFPKEKIYIFLSAMLSPLMIILSSQILTETIFLFFFTLFIYYAIKVITKADNIYYNIALAGLFLGFSTLIRSITYPLIFLSLFPFIIILVKKNFFKYKIFFVCIVFLVFAILPISSRILNNLQIHSSLSLTSQTGTHLAYWSLQ